MVALHRSFFFFFFNDTATTEIYTLSLHDALPICGGNRPAAGFEREHGEGAAVSRARAPSGASSQVLPPRRPPGKARRLAESADLARGEDVAGGGNVFENPKAKRMPEACRAAAGVARRQSFASRVRKCGTLGRCGSRQAS